MRWRGLVLLAGLVAPLLVTLPRPVNFDEANFLMLAGGAWVDPWRPHDTLVNWQGTTERAFDVLSNPPGLAWWLAPVIAAPTWLQRALMLPWFVMATWGAALLGGRFGRSGLEGALFLLTAPIVLLSATALLPDMPLYACVLAGVGGFVSRLDANQPAWPFALLAGLAACFRYSGLAVIPLLFLYAWLHRRPFWPALAALVPTALLAAHDLAAYGAWHLLAMGKFQSVSNGPADLAHKAAAMVAMLGGAAALPLFPWRGTAWAGAGLGALLALPFGGVAALFGALGGAALSGLGGDRARADRLFLAAWALLGIAFLLALRFTATRYWLPFLPPVLLAMPATWPRLRVSLGLSLGALLLLDDAFHARAAADLAARVAATGVGRFVGHWGWQHALEEAGWTALDEGSDPGPGTLVAVPRQAWPQAANLHCNLVVFSGQADARLAWLPRGYSEAASANLHANWIAGHPPVRTVIPWWFATDPYESARVCAE